VHCDIVSCNLKLILRARFLHFIKNINVTQGAFGNSGQSARIIPSAHITVCLFARMIPCVFGMTDQINLTMFETLGVARPSVLRTTKPISVAVDLSINVFNL